MTTARAEPGFLASTRAAGGVEEIDLRRALAAVGVTDARIVHDGSVTIAIWGLPEAGRQAVPLGTVVRSGDRDVGPPELTSIMDDPDARRLGSLLPPCAAVRLVDGRVQAFVDAMGFRQLYCTRSAGGAGLSTSAIALAGLSRAAADREALAVQSLVGWQVGRRTLFAGVEQIAAGSFVELSHGEIRRTTLLEPVTVRQGGLSSAVAEASEVLRTALTAYLDDHADAVLQLTGGQDSRLLLSAIPLERRRGIRTVTLGVPGNEDVVIAAELSDRFGMPHTVATLDGLSALAPSEIHDRAVLAARRVECMADPLSMVSVTFAEREFPQGPRLSGLGGEVARGFYYATLPIDMRVTDRRARRLATWRMLANESVPAEVMDPAFGAWARSFVLDEVSQMLRDSGPDMRRASDAFYYEQRMQRWAGVTDTAVCFDRAVANPMLDKRFLDIARGLAPKDKANSRFLAQLQVALDRELAAVPLDGRPPPTAYATTSISGAARIVSTTARKTARKAWQRARRARRPPGGGEVLAAKVREHWLSLPDPLEPLRELGVFRSEWLTGVERGTERPGPSTVSLLVNLGVVAAAIRTE